MSNSETRLEQHRPKEREKTAAETLDEKATALHCLCVATWLEALCRTSKL